MNYRALFVSTFSGATLVAGAAFADEQAFDFSDFDAVSVSSGVEDRKSVV